MSSLDDIRCIGAVEYLSYTKGMDAANRIHAQTVI
jgi:hypothetical protein